MACGDPTSQPPAEAVGTEADDGTDAPDGPATSGGTRDDAPAVTITDPPPAPTTEDAMATVGVPIEVAIPALDITADVLALDLRADGTIEVPPDHADAGWYRHGARAGEPGPTVLGAHVDWDGVPGVFRDIDTLRAGDTVEVADDDGRRTTYVVEHVEQHRKDAFPTFDVYGVTAADTLRLVTCGGPFIAEERSHRDNIVVFATALA